MPCSVAIAFKKAPLDIAFAPAFIDFMGGNMMLTREGSPRTRSKGRLAAPC